MLPRNMTVRDYVVYVFAFHFWKHSMAWLIKHPFGRISESQRYYIPVSEVPRATREAQIIMAFCLAVAAVSAYFFSWLAVWLWTLPRLVGEPFMRWIRVT